MNMISQYEMIVLGRIRKKEWPEDPGAAWWAATESLVGQGLLKRGEVTKKGVNHLQYYETMFLVEKLLPTQIAEQIFLLWENRGTDDRYALWCIHATIVTVCSQLNLDVPIGHMLQEIMNEEISF